MSAWYDELREAHRPHRLRVLLIGESPPDPGPGDRRFFYWPELRIDNLYRGVAEAVYGQDIALQPKARVLKRLQADGFWLIDATDTPVNRMRGRRRAAAIRAAVPGLVTKCRELRPALGVVICKKSLYELTVGPLRAAGVGVLHDVALPFPLGNWRAGFVAGLRRALEKANGVAAK